MMNENLRSTDTPTPVDPVDESRLTRVRTSGPGYFRRIGLLLVVAFIAVVVDQITKRLVESRIELGNTEPLASFLWPYLTLTHTVNSGAAFGILLQGGAVFFLVGGVVMALILYYAPRLPVKDRLSRVALGLQLGGAIGNLVDRTRIGVVTDFIHFQIPQLNFDWPVFNIADSCIVVGVIILIVSSFFQTDGAVDDGATTRPD